MPIYSVKAPSGKTLDFEGDTPPTEEAIQQAFRAIGEVDYASDSSENPVWSPKPIPDAKPFEPSGSQKTAPGYVNLTNQDLQDISDSWTTSTLASLVLGGANQLTFGLGSEAISSALGLFGADRSAEQVRAWSKIQEKEHPWANLAGAAAGAVASTIAAGAASAASGGTVAPGATALAATRWGRVAQLAQRGSKAIQAPIKVAQKAKTGVLKGATKVLGEGAAEKTLVKTAARAAEGAVIAAEYEGAQMIGTAANLATGVITPEQAAVEFHEEYTGVPTSMLYGSALSGVAFPVLGAGAKWTNKVFNYAKGKMRVRQDDIDALRQVVGQETLDKVYETTSATLKKGSEVLSALEKGSPEYQKAEEQLTRQVNNTFWETLVENADPEKVAVLSEVIRKNPTLRDRVLAYFAPTETNIKQRAVDLTNREYGVVSEQMNLWMDNGYSEGPKGVVKNLGQGHINDTLGRGELMKETRQTMYDMGLDDLQGKVDVEKQGIFANLTDAETFKGQAGGILRSAKTNVNNTIKVRDSANLDNIPSLKKGTTARAAFDEKVEKDYVRALQARAKAEADTAAMTEKLSPEQHQALQDRIFDQLNKDQRMRQENYLQKAVQKQNDWFNEITTMGTDDVRDLNYLKDIIKKSLPEEVEAGSQTPWGKAHTDINNLFRRYSGRRGMLTQVLDTDAMGDRMDAMYRLGREYGKNPARDKELLERSLAEIAESTPNPTGDVAIHGEAIMTNKAGGWAYFKAGLLEQAQNAAMNGDIAELARLRDIMKGQGGLGLLGYVTPNELATTFENLIPVARAARNTRVVLAAARGTSAEATKDITAPEVRFIVSTLTGGTNTALNALVTILDRGQWGPKIADGWSNVLKTGTAEAWNSVLNDINKDPAAQRQLGRYLDMFWQEMKPRIEGGWGAGLLNQ